MNRGSWVGIVVSSAVVCLATSAPVRAMGTVRKQAASQQLFEKGLTLQGQGRTDEALEAFDEAAQVYPKNASAQIERGGIYFERREWAKALEAFDLAQDVAERDPEVLYHLARCYWEIGKRAKARKWWTRTVEAKPDHARALYGLGRYALEDQEPGEAEGFFARALRADPGHAAAAWELAHLKLAKRAATEALGLFEKSLASDEALASTRERASLYDETLSDEERADAHYQAGALDFDAKQTQGAERHFLEAVARGKSLAQADLADAHYRLGLLYYDAGKAEASEEHFRADVVLDAKNGDSFWHLGLLRFAAQDAAGATEAFQAAVRLDDPKVPPPGRLASEHLHLGILAYGKGLHPEAEKELDRSIGLFASSASAHLFRALALNGQGRAGEAAGAFARAVELDPKGTEGFAREGAILFAQGDLKGAETALRSAVALKPDHASSRYLLGRIEYGADRLEEAARDFETALRPPAPLPPPKLGGVADSSPLPSGDLPDLHWRLAKSYDRTGSPRKAETHYLAHLGALPTQPSAELVQERDEAEYRLGILTFDDHRLKEAAGWFEKTAGLDPYAVDAHYHLALIAYARKDLSGTIREAQATIARKDDHAKARFLEGRAYFDQKDWVRARDAFLAALDRDAKRPSEALGAEGVACRLLLARAFMSIPHYLEAADDLKAALVVDAANPEVRGALDDIARRWSLAASAGPTAAAAAPEAAPEGPKRLAIAGFAAAEGSAAGAGWLGVGIPEAMATDLGKLSSIQLVERAQVERLLQEKKLSEVGLIARAAPEIGKELKASALLVGTFHVGAGEKLRIDARLVDAAGGGVLKTASTQGRLADVFDLERKAALDAVAAWAHVSNEERERILRGEKRDLKAFEAFAQGRKLALVGNNEAAAKFYQEAMKTDPRYQKALEDLKTQASNRSDTLAVMPFTNATGRTDLDWLKVGIPEALTTDLKQSTGIYLVERLNIEKALQEMKLASSGVVDEKSAPQIGKMVGAGIVVVGSYQALGANVRLDMRMVDVESGQILLTESSSGPMDKIFDLERDLALKVAKTLKVNLSAEDVAKLNKEKPDIESFKRYIMAHTTLEVARPATNGAVRIRSVAASRFRNLTGKAEYDWLQDGIPGSLTTDLKSQGRIGLVERVQMEKALEEMKLGSTGVVDEAMAPKLGSLVGADAVIVGQFQVRDSQVRIDARVVKVDTSEVLASADVTGGLSDLFGLENQLAGKIAQGLKIPPAGGFPAVPVVSSVLIPGSAQLLYNRQKTKGAIMLGAGGALALGAIYFNADYETKYAQYTASRSASTYNSALASFNLRTYMFAGLVALNLFSAADAWFFAGRAPENPAPEGGAKSSANPAPQTVATRWSLGGGPVDGGGWSLAVRAEF